MTQGQHEDAQEVFGLWRLLQLLEEMITAAAEHGEVPDLELTPAFVGNEPDLPSIHRGISVIMLATADMKVVLEAFARGHPIQGHQLRSILYVHDEPERWALRAAEQAAQLPWPKVQISGEIQDPAEEERFLTDRSVFRWAVQQFLSLIVDSLTTVGLNDEVARDLILARLSRYSPTQLHWIFRAGDLTLSSGQLALLTLAKIAPWPPPRRIRRRGGRPRRGKSRNGPNHAD